MTLNQRIEDSVMLNTILIPVDGSQNSFTAIDYGIYIAPRFEATLTGLHIVDIYLIQGPLTTDLSSTAGIPPYNGFIDAIETSLQEKADGILKTFADRCAKAGVACTGKKNLGNIGDVIIDESKDADLIVMARKGEHFHLNEGSLLGSVAKAVVRHAGKPVLITPERFLEIESMALAYDGSLPAQKALDLSLAVSEKARWPMTVIIVTSDRQKAADLSSQVEDRAQHGAADCEIITLSGREPDEILKFIREGSVELMVMGAYGHNRLHELLVGSTTSHIIKNSPIPVLLIR